MPDDTKRIGDGKQILIVGRPDMSKVLLQACARLRAKGLRVHVGNIAKYKVVAVYKAETLMFSEELTLLFEEQVYDVTVKGR